MSTTNNLGIIKSIILNQLNEAYFSKKISKNVDDLTADFIETVRSSPVLQLEMRVFDNIENKYIDNDTLASRYIDTCLKLFENINIDDFRNSNIKLNKLLSENENLDIIKDDSNIKLYNAVYNLIEQTLLKYDADVDILHESFTIVLEHIKTNTKVMINENLNNDIMDELVLKIAVDKFNEKYSKILTEEDQKLIKNLNNSNIEDKKNIFEEYKNKNLEIIKNIKVEDEADEKVKEKLISRINENIDAITKMTFNESESDDQILKLYELNKNLL